MNISKLLIGLALSVALVACGGGGGSAGTPSGGSGAASGTTTTTTTTTTAADPTATVASISLSSSANSVKADGISLVTFTVLPLTGGNALVTGATINLSATNDVVLSAPTVVSTATGATVTMTALSSNRASRVSTVTASISCATCATVTSTVQVNVIGATVTLSNSGGSSLVIGGSTASLSSTVRDVSGNAISGTSVSFAATDTNILSLSAASAITNSAGVATVTVTGVGIGGASVNVSALGNAAAQTYTSAAATGVLSFASPANNSVMVTNLAQSITATAPGATSVTFSTTQGTFVGSGTTSQTVAVAGGSASASLTAIQAGTITVTVNDNLSRLANLTLLASPPVSSVNKILLNATQTTLAISSATNQNSITVTARAVFNTSGADQNVANVPIQFSMTGGPGAGEFLSPALAFTNSAGVATATFTSGTAASIANGIVISAKVQGTAVQTGTAPSSNNILATIGGQALSVAFGPASVLGQSSDNTLYIQAYSVQVTDANNNPVANTTVTLRLRPVAFSLGGACTITATYCAEDANGNGSLDAGEDGVRKTTTVATAGSCSSALAGAAGTTDAILTPQNSDGGSVPSTVVTDANGIAPFNLTYLKQSALWVVDKLTATVSSNGTENSNSTIFRLAPTVPDVGPPCLLPPSPYSF